MKLYISLILLGIVAGCGSKNELPVLQTSSETISILEGNVFYEDIWAISPEIELDEFITNSFNGEKKVSFISDIDTLTFVVSPNHTYDFVIQYKEEKAMTRINTDSLLEPTLLDEALLSYYYDKDIMESVIDTLSFVIGEDNGIHLKGRINNSDTLDFLFDTGADAVVITSSLIGDKVSVKLDGDVENEGSDGISNIETSSSNKLEIDYLNWEDVFLLAIDYENPSFDGVLGWVAFEDKVLELDYENKRFIIHNSMETVPTGYSKIETKMIDNVPFLKGNIVANSLEAEGWFEYDSGYNGSFSLSQKFAFENKLKDDLEIVGTSSSSGSTGAELKANNYILPKLCLGEFELINIPLSIDEVDPEGIENNDILGNNLLKRFNAIIDLQNFEVYLKPNRLLNIEY